MNSARILRHARRHAGLTQRALAQLAGIPQPAIARIERGAVSPRVSTLAELLAKLSEYERETLADLLDKLQATIVGPPAVER